MDRNMCKYCFNSNISNVQFAMQMVYGGKVLDDFDRRTLFAYLDEYLGSFLFDSFQPFHFYKNNNHENYRIPYAANTKQDFLGKFLVAEICNNSYRSYLFICTHSMHS